VYSLLCLLYTKNLLSPVASLLRTNYSSWDGVLCFLSLFLFLLTYVTLDSFSLFLCQNPALSFTAVSVCLIYNNVSARVSLDQALLGVFLSVLWQLQSNCRIFLYCLFFSSQWLLDSQCSNLGALSLSGVSLLVSLGRLFLSLLFLLVVCFGEIGDLDTVAVFFVLE
jgi:hypothetical protein